MSPWRQQAQQPATSSSSFSRSSGSAATRASSWPATFGAATSTSSSFVSRSSSGEREPTSPVAIRSTYGPRSASNQDRRRHSGQARGSAMLAPPHLQGLRHLLLAYLIQSRQVGQGLRQTQRPVMGATAEPLPRVEVGEQRGRTVAQRAGPRLGGGHLRVAAAATKPPLLTLARGADPLPHSR